MSDETVSRRLVLGVGIAVLLLAALMWSARRTVQTEPGVGAPATSPELRAAAVPLYSDLGAHAWSISTSVPQAQQYFNQGLRLSWGFNHAEAIRAFAEAERLDPTCAMCAWGIAWAYGPNINLPMDSASGLLAWDALTRARARADRAAPLEQALIEALASRYAQHPPADRSALDSAYARQMAAVAERFPADAEAQVLAADATMNLSPWNYWNAEATPREGTSAMLRQLEGVMAANADHPGACHLYIHAVEAYSPERAVPCAERLASLMPGAGHVVHMPGHIYVRVGRFEDAIRANEHAVHADETYIRDQQPALGMYTTGYYPHNYDFLAFAASMLGREQQAIQAAGRAGTAIPKDALYAPGMGYAQTHLTRHLQMKIRFSQWQEILRTTAPDTALPHARGMWEYARGRAQVATGDIAGAKEALRAVRDAATRAREVPLRLEFNTSHSILTLAGEVLAGRIAEQEGHLTEALAHLRRAVALEDALTYGEPPEWSIPVRQELGQVLLSAGRREEAAVAFRADLKRFPRNTWSTTGLANATGSATPPPTSRRP